MWTECNEAIWKLVKYIYSFFGTFFLKTLDIAELTWYTHACQMASDRKDGLMQFTKDQIIKLRDLEGKTLSYAQLCDSAQIKKLAGASKKKQLKELYE